MSALAHISDLHFGTERPEVLAALERWIAERAPELVVLSGDVTQRARRAQFAAAHAFVARLEAPVLAVPGNHDIALFNLPARLFAPYAAYRRAIARELEPVWESPRWLVIGVKTTRRRRHVDGEVSPAQIARVSARLRAARPGQRRVVVTHQPVWVPRADERHNLLHGHAQAIEAWAGAGADLLLGGHIHLPYRHALELDYPGLARRLWVVQAGTAISRRVRPEAPNSVNLLRAGEAHDCALERWDYDEASAAFVPRETAQLPLSA